jgi:HK97 family phage major capsid protein
MDMSRTLSRGLRPGQIDHLRRVGVDLAELGRIKNRANVSAPATEAEIDAIPLPVNDTELGEFYASNNSHVRMLLKHPQNMSRFTSRYAKAQQGDGTALHQSIKAEVQSALLQHMKDMTGDDRRVLDKMRADGRLNLDPQKSTPGQKWAAAYNPKADGAVLDGEFADLGDYCSAIHFANRSAENVSRMSRIMNSFSSIVPSDGGFLIPETLRAELLRVSLENAVIRSRARVIPMETLRVPIPMIDSTTNNGSVYGGMIAYWAEESAALTESQAKFGKIVLEANKLTGFAIAPNELLNDSLMSFVALIDQLWPEALAFFEDLGFIRGSGVGEPYGVLNNLATVAVAKETGQAANTILWENVVKMFARMLPASLNRAVWLVSPDVFPQLATMALSVGTGGSAVWLNNGVGGPPATILGRPVVITEKMNTLGAQGDIAFVDLGYYLIGDRQQMSARSSEEYRFANDQTAFRIIQRVTGRPWLQNALTPANGGNTLSPFVELAVRA